MSIRSLAVLLVGASLLSGCVSAESRWQTAQKHDTVAAYEAFLEKAPKASYASPARERIEQLKFQQAAKAGTVPALEAYLREYPEGQNAPKARDQLDEIVFAQAQKTRTITAFDAYLKRYPQGLHVSSAQEGIRQLKLEQARNTDTLQAMEAYLKEYPTGQLSAEADAAAERAAWLIVEKNNRRIEVYRDYRRLFPRGVHAGEAADAIHYAGAERRGTQQDFQQYLTQYPKGRYASNARRNMAQVGQMAPEAIAQSMDAMARGMAKQMEKNMAFGGKIVNFYPFTMSGAFGFTVLSEDGEVRFAEGASIDSEVFGEITTYRFDGHVWKVVRVGKCAFDGE